MQRHSYFVEFLPLTSHLLPVRLEFMRTNGEIQIRKGYRKLQVPSPLVHYNFIGL